MNLKVCLIGLHTSDFLALLHVSVEQDSRDTNGNLEQNMISTHLNDWKGMLGVQRYPLLNVLIYFLFGDAFASSRIPDFSKLQQKTNKNTDKSPVNWI